MFFSFFPSVEFDHLKPGTLIPDVDDEHAAYRSVVSRAKPSERRERPSECEAACPLQRMLGGPETNHGEATSNCRLAPTAPSGQIDER